jgi:hypothetical protein
MNRQNLLKNGNSLHPSYHVSNLDDVESEIHIDDDDQVLGYPKRRWIAAIVPVVSFVLAAFLVVICAIAVLLLIRWSASGSMRSMEESSCGSTAAEAKARGCVFDVMSFSWLPRDCYDEELVAEFLQATDAPWQWFSDSNLTTAARYDVGRAKQGTDAKLFVTNEYHR